MGSSGLLVIVTSLLSLSKNPETFDVLKWLNIFSVFLCFWLITEVVFSNLEGVTYL